MSQNASNPGSLDHPTGIPTTSEIVSLSLIDPSINTENIVDKYWELKTRFQELEEENGDELQRSSECHVERNSLLEIIVKLEKQPQIHSLAKSAPLNGAATCQTSDNSTQSVNRVRKRAEKPGNKNDDLSRRRSKRPRMNLDSDSPKTDELAVTALLIERASRSQSSSPLQMHDNSTQSKGDDFSNHNPEATHRSPRGKISASDHTFTQNSDMAAPSSSSSGPVIDPSLTAISETLREGVSSSPTPVPPPNPSSTAVQPSGTSSMASNPYAAYLTSHNPYAYYYLHSHLPPGMHPGMAMPGIPPPGMYVPLLTSPVNTSKPAVPMQSQQPNHPSRPGQTKQKRLKSHTITTKSFNIPIVPRDSQGKPMLPLNVGIMTIISLGEVCLREHFHTERYIFPVGYQVTRRYLSTQDKNREVVYHCTILDGGDGPKFQIIPSDAPDLTVIAGTATGAWSNIVRKANAIRNRQHSNSVSGPDFFGLGQNTIKHLIQQLPNAEKLRDYVWQNFVEGGPLGGRHAAVVPALPEDYGGAFYGPGNNQPPPNQAVNSKHYPPYSNASTASLPSQSGQDSVPIDPQLAAPIPCSDASDANAQNDVSSIMGRDSSGVAATITSIMDTLPSSDSSVGSS